VSDYEAFDKRAVLNNIMIVDQLFKANGAIHKICFDMQRDYETNREDGYNGFSFSLDPDIYNFHLYANDFTLSVDDKSVFCFYGGFGIQFKPKTGESIENFKQLLLTLINIASEQKFDNIEQFVDLHNMTYI
jgi:hypothetical protein